MSLDGTCLDVADTLANARKLGRPGSSRRDGRMVQARKRQPPDGSYLARIYPSQKDQGAGNDGQQVRVIGGHVTTQPSSSAR